MTEIKAMLGMIHEQWWEKTEDFFLKSHFLLMQAFTGWLMYENLHSSLKMLEVVV